MKRVDVKAILDRVLTWPQERQADAAELLILIEEHDKSPYGLSDAQAAEVRRRLEETDEPTVTLSELDERLRRLGVLRSFFAARLPKISSRYSIGSPRTILGPRLRS
jgi:hypothetical protein